MITPPSRAAADRLTQCSPADTGMVAGPQSGQQDWLAAARGAPRSCRFFLKESPAVVGTGGVLLARARRATHVPGKYFIPTRWFCLEER